MQRMINATYTVAESFGLTHMLSVFATVPTEATPPRT
jgi:hypothetical protein